MPPEEPNYLAHAFKSQYNLIGLGTALGFAVLSGTLLPIILAAGVEMIVLPLVSGSGRPPDHKCGVLVDGVHLANYSIGYALREIDELPNPGQRENDEKPEPRTNRSTIVRHG